MSAKGSDVAQNIFSSMGNGNGSDVGEAEIIIPIPTLLTGASSE